jgi:hypothetical protein
MKITIGRSDKADFPELELFELNIKVDTGAYTSSIHCHEIKEIQKDDVWYIKFNLLDPSHEQYNEKEFFFKNYRKKNIKNSFGSIESRYAIKTVITLFNQTFPIELTLSERSDMKFPVLLGRRFLNKKFIVDPSKKNLSHKQS